MNKLLTLAVLTLLLGCGGGGGATGGSSSPPAPTLQSISVGPSSPTVVAGLTQQLTATAHYSDGSSKDITSAVTWSSSNATLATVNSGTGLAKGVAQGTTTITASFGGMVGSAQLTVNPPQVVSIAVGPSSPTVVAGLTQQMTATGSYTDGSSKDVTNSATWSSSNSLMATVNSGTGLTKGVAQGTATISASIGGIVGSIQLTVNPPAVVSIAVTPPSPLVHPNFSQQFDAMAQMTDGTVRDITSAATTQWNSDATSVATISNNAGTIGLSTGVSAGTAHITAVTTNGVNGSVTSNAVTLTVTNASLLSISLSPSTSQTISLATFQLFTATGFFSDTTQLDLTQTATWVSSNTAVTKVAAGQANGVGLGIANVTATQGGVTSSPVQLTVDLSGLIGLTIQPASAQIAVGTSQVFKAVATFQNGATLNVTTLPQLSWSSDNTATASIGQHTGQAKALTSNSAPANITATFGTFSPSVPLTVSTATITAVTVTPRGLTIPINTTQTFLATGTFSDNTTQTLTSSDVSWSSSNTSEATINASGTATGIAPTNGTPVNMTATFSANPSFSGSAPLNITGANLSSIAISPTNSILAPGLTLTYSSVGTYSDGTNHSVSNVATWNSSDTTVATLSGSVATGVRRGNATITAALNGITSNSATLVVEGSPLTAILLAPAVISIPQQVKTQFTATGVFQDGSTQNLTTFVLWSTNPDSIVTISNAAGSQGQATSLSTPGAATVTAAYGGLSGAGSLTVSSATLVSIAITPLSPSVSAGSTVQLNAIGTFTDGSRMDLSSQVTWKCNNGAIAVISSSGVATGITAGAANITAALNGVTNSTVLNVL